MMMKKELIRKRDLWIHSSQRKRKIPIPPPPSPPPLPTPAKPKIQPTGTKKKIPDKVRSILFVPRTPESDLAKIFRKDKQTI